MKPVPDLMVNLVPQLGAWGPSVRPLGPSRTRSGATVGSPASLEGLPAAGVLDRLDGRRRPPGQARPTSPPPARPGGHIGTAI